MSSNEIVLARTQAWIEKAVIGLNLCPFAKAVHVQKQIRYRVSQAETTEDLLEDLFAELEYLVKVDPALTDTSLLIHPLMLTDFLEFNDFMTIADEALAELRLVGTIQIANFHPDYQFEGTVADDITNYTNRSPYPTLHLLREASIDKAVASMEDPDDIFRKNIETLRNLGLEGWRKLNI